jgi:hypothetical protein
MDITITNNAVTLAGGPGGFATTVNYQGAVLVGTGDEGGVENFTEHGVTKLTIIDGGRFNHIHAASVPDFTHVTVKGAFSDVVDGAAADRIDMQRVRAFPPAAVNHTYYTNLNGSLNIPAASGVLAGASDAENDPLTAVALPAPAGVPSHGQVLMAGDGSFHYQPAPGYFGWDSFSYQISDGDGLSNVATVSIVVLPRVVASHPGLTFATLDLSMAFSHSTEYYANFVTAAYQKYLGRGPDAAGLAGWVSAMQSHGLTDERLEAGFIGSAEYIRNHGGSGRGWVAGMYRDLLGREPGAAEVDFWVRHLQAGMAPADVAYGFAASAEREGQRITTDYQQFLGRTPDAQGLASWVNAFVHGTSTNEDVVAGFVGSAESFHQHKGAFDWLLGAYQGLLGRKPSATELAGWLQ